MASSEDPDKLLGQVKRDIRSLLISAKSGLVIQDLYRDYQSLVFTTLPFRRLGFETARAFLQSMPDVCRCQMLPGGDCLVTAVADSSTAHIQKMVERQKPSQKRGATARVLASRYGVRRSPPARATMYRAQPTQSWFRAPAPTRPEQVRPEYRPQPAQQEHRPQPVQQEYRPQPAQQEHRPQPVQPEHPSPQVELEPRGQPAAEQGGRAKSPEEVPARVAGRLAQLLLGIEEGVSADRLAALYDAAVPEERLDWAGRGYRSCADLLLRLPHIARVVNSTRGLLAYPSRALLAADRESKVFGAGPAGQESTSPDGDSDRRTSPAGASSPAPASGPAPANSRTSSGRRQSLLASISDIVQTIVAKHPNGLLCSNLPTEYMLQTGRDLAVAEHGYHSVLDLVSRLPVRVIKSNAFGDWLLFTPSQPLPDFVNDQTHADDGLIQGEEGGSRLLEAKERIRDILFSFPDGLRMSSLEDHYQMNCNERLPYSGLGFSSVETFVLHLTGNVLHVKYTTDGLKLYPIVPTQPDRTVVSALYPSDSVGPGHSFERVKLPDVPPGEYNLEIFVAEVYHPHKFWFHLVGEQYAEALEKLMDAMEMTYCTTLGFKYRMQEATVRVGQVCACPYSEQGYHRAVITGVRPAPEPVKVFYVDYGSVGTVSRDFLRFLPEEFFRLPAQALLGRLANILQPDVDCWSREASKTFLSLVDNNRILYAMVLERSPSCVSLCLCDTNGDTDLHVNDRLVELGYAVFRNQSVDIDDKAVEELSRPVSVAPSPSSAAAAPVLPAAAAVQLRSVSPELREGRDTPSDIDRLLQETLENTGTAATFTPVSPSVPGQPPGFSSVPPLPPPAPGSSSAFTQMLTQSALLNNLQLMQLQSLMNPMMNPAYAALLMSQACGGAMGAARPAFPVGALPAAPGGPGAAALVSGAPSAAAPVPGGLGTAAPVPVVSAASLPPASAPNPGTATSPEVAGPPPTPSAVSSGQDAGVCITAPIQASSTMSCRELDEDEIAQMNRELGELGIQRRFVKQMPVPDGVVHLICLDGEGYLVSAEISHFLWTRDILHTMLLMKRVTLPHRSIDVESHQELFTELVRYNVPGVMEGDELVDPLTLYPITCVPRVFTVFKNMKSEHDVKAVIEGIIAEFDAAEPYWTGPDGEEDELAELCSETEFGGAPSAVREPSLRESSMCAGSPLAGFAPSLAASPPAEEAAAGGSGDADLLPEMRTILAQLQTKRRRKVEATMMGLQGTGFSPGDVIGDDLCKLDAQIASFQRRIDDMTSESATGRPWSRQEPRRTSSVRSASISMNPDAPEFVHPWEDYVYVSMDNTICMADGEEPAVQRRSRVELRAPDGTPVELSQLVSRAQTLQLGSPEGDPHRPLAPSTPPRRPVELCTPDGQPVQLRRPSRAASSPHGSPQSPQAPAAAASAAPLTAPAASAAPLTASAASAAPLTASAASAAPLTAPATTAAAGQTARHPAPHPYQIPQPRLQPPLQPPVSFQQPPQSTVQQPLVFFQQLPQSTVQQPPVSFQQPPASFQQPQSTVQQPLPLPTLQHPLRPPQLLAGQVLRHQSQQSPAPAGPRPATQLPPPQQQQQQQPPQQQQQPQQQQKQQQWPRLPAQQPPYGMVYPAYQQAYLQYQPFMPAAGSFARLPQPLGYPPQVYPMQAGYQPAPAPYPPASAPYPPASAPQQGGAGPAYPSQ